MRPEAAGACLAFDTGPANAPIDDLMQVRRGARFDGDGALALQGVADASLVASVLERGYFLKMPPKSLDRNDFPDLTAAWLSAHPASSATARPGN